MSQATAETNRKKLNSEFANLTKPQVITFERLLKHLFEVWEILATQEDCKLFTKKES